MRMQLLRTAAYGLMAAACFSPSDAGAMESAMTDDGDSFSLADLADIDVSEIAEVRFETLPAGVFEWEVVDADLEEGVDKEGAKRFNAIFKMKVVECVACLERGVDRESLVGKQHQEKLFIHPGKTPEEVQQAIGRIRAFVADLGCDNAGKLGDIVRNTKGHTFKSKIVHQTDKEDKSIKYARMKFDTKK